MAIKNSSNEENFDLYPKTIDKRLEQLRFSFVDEQKVDAIAVTYLPNIRYLTNFSGSAGILFIMQDEIHFVTDDRYEEQIKDELYPLENLTAHITRFPWEYMVDNGLFGDVQSMAFEADSMPYSEAVEIRNKVRPVKFKPATNLVTRFMQPKAPEELEYIKQAATMAEEVYKYMLGIIKPGMTEREVAMEIAYHARRMGSEGVPSEIIVISGPRGAIVNGAPSDRKLKKNDLVILDFGCRVNGFGTDISRTIALGKASKEYKQIYATLREAQKAAIKGVRPGMNGRHLDSIARKIIDKAGFSDYFRHDLGHGVGLRAIEEPIITPRSDDYIVPEESVITVEPGVYIPEKFGMRVEEIVLVTKNGGELLTKAPDEMDVIA